MSALTPKAKATWSASLNEEYMPPEEFAQFHFGDAPKFWHYGEDRDDETANNEDDQESWGAHGELTLAEDGTASIELPPPPANKEALPQTISIYADVTDVNQQTISANTDTCRNASRAWMLLMCSSTTGQVRIASASRMP